MIKVIIATLIILPLLANAEYDIFTVKSIKCSFSRGTAIVMRQSEKDWSTKEIKEPYDLVFDNIDLTNNSAREIGFNAAGDVEVYRSNIGLKFINSSPREMLNDGYFTTVIVTPIRYSAKGFPAVLNRVIYSSFPSAATLGSQYFGFCKSISN